MRPCRNSRCSFHLTRNPLQRELSSGNCGKGAFSAAVSEYLGQQVGHVSDPRSLSNWGVAGETAKYALIGGAASKLVGGDFVEGFSIAAAGYVFNQVAQHWHQYSAGPNVVCTAAQQCTPEQMKDYMSRFDYPGQDPSRPVTAGNRYWVTDPTTGLTVGPIIVDVSANGLTLTNTTLSEHWLYEGQVTRTATLNPDGSWSVTTYGWGANASAGLAYLNQVRGPPIFNGLDQQLTKYISQHQN